MLLNSIQADLYVQYLTSLGVIISQCKVGSENKEISHRLDFINDYNMLTNNYYNVKNSKTAKNNGNKSLNYGNMQIKVDKISEEISIEDKQKVKLNFLYYEDPEKSTPKVFDSFGMALNFEDKENFLLYQLKKNGLIDYMGLNIYAQSFEFDGMIAYGKVQPSVKKSMEKITIYPNLQYKFWNFNSDYFYLDYNKTKGYILKDFLIMVKYDQREITVPLKFFNFLVENDFNKELKNNQCQIDLTTSGLSKIECTCTSLYRYRNLYNFIVNKKDVITIDRIDLFYSSGDRCFFTVRGDPNLKDTIYAGSDFFKNHHVFYDFEHKNIQFYQDDKFKVFDSTILDKNRGFKKWCLIICIILLLFFSLINFLVFLFK